MTVRDLLLAHLEQHNHYLEWPNKQWLVRYDVGLHFAMLQNEDLYEAVKKANPNVPPLETIQSGSSHVDHAILLAAHQLLNTGMYRTPSAQAAKQYRATQKPYDVQFAIIGRMNSRLVVKSFKGHCLDIGFLDVLQDPTQFDNKSCRELLALLQTWETEFAQLKVCRTIESFAQDHMLDCLMVTAAEQRESAYWAARDVMTEVE